ncbi:MAG: T9SS type A sorting domain-containing protein [Bacteroidales bacterium]|nr:T9SS type A sorting domain-containing protein [Bacteroidales bacterium]
MKQYLTRLSILIMFIVSLSTGSKSQTYTVNYSYDANGNRIDRIIIVVEDCMETPIDTTAIIRSSFPQQKEYKDNNSIGISVYPNPVMEGLTIRLTSCEKYTDIKANLYSTLGVCVKNIDIIAKETYVDLSDLSSGSYFLKLIGCDDGRLWKIIKR